MIRIKTAPVSAIRYDTTTAFVQRNSDSSCTGAEALLEQGQYTANDHKIHSRTDIDLRERWEEQVHKIRKQRTTTEDKRSSVINFGHSTQPAEVPRAYQEPRQALVKHHQVLWYYFGHWGALEFFPQIPWSGINTVSVQGNIESLVATMSSMPVQFHANQIQFTVLLFYLQLKVEKRKKKPSQVETIYFFINRTPFQRLLLYAQ